MKKDLGDRGYGYCYGLGLGHSGAGIPQHISICHVNEERLVLVTPIWLAVGRNSASRGN